MTEASPQSSRNAWRERVQALKNVPPVLGILWESGPAVVTWGLILRIFVAALPPRLPSLRPRLSMVCSITSATRRYYPTFGGW